MRKQNAGFTLIEFLLVIGIIATIMMFLFLMPAIWNWLAPQFSAHVPVFAQWWINLGKVLTCVLVGVAIFFAIITSGRR